jgi:peptidoglycan/LPS O-acetylase OafA/YrhL
MSFAASRPLPEPALDGRVAALDGLRGIAVALVVWKHLVNPYLPLGFGEPLAWLGAIGHTSWIGVDLFFVLSGFFIGGILIDRRDSPHLARVFYLRRALRILPLFYLTLAAGGIGLACGWIRPEYPLWSYPLFLSNIMLALGNHWDDAALSLLWSIAVEEQFYLAAPWVVRWVPLRSLPWLLGALIVLALALRLAVHWLWPEYWLAQHTLMPLRMDLLAAGALVAWALRSGRFPEMLAWLRERWRWCLGAIALLLLTLAANRPSLGSPQLIGYGYTLIAFCFALLVLLVAGARPPALCRFLSWGPLTHLGRHSYFVYLWHMLIGLPIITWLGRGQLVLESLPALLIVLAGVGTTWAAAIVSWRFFEGPLVARGHRYRY